MLMMKNSIKKIAKIIGYEIKKIQPDLSFAQITNYKVPYEKIHYGAGKRIFKEWVNVDYFEYNNNDNFPNEIKVDLAKRHPFADNTFSFGYSEDFLEHLTQADQIIFLEEVFRTLQPGGVVRLSFPGLEGSLSRYYKNISYIGCEQGKKDAFTNYVHFHLPTLEELILICKYLGFSKIEKVQYGKSIYEELSNLDSRKNQIGLNIMVEVTK
jgi:predicted SAM-dependent methyltransferase